MFLWPSVNKKQVFCICSITVGKDNWAKTYKNYFLRKKYRPRRASVPEAYVVRQMAKHTIKQIFIILYSYLDLLSKDVFYDLF